MGVDGDQAHRAFALERAELFRHARAREPKAAAALGHLDRNQVAILGLAAGARRNSKLAADLLLVDRHQPSAATGERAENPQDALPRAVDELDDAAGMTDCLVVLAGLFHAQQGAIADAGDLVGPGAARDVHADLRRGAVLGLVPFGRQRDQLAVGIAGGDVGQHDLRQGPGLMQLLAAALDLTVVGELSQHMLERDAVGSSSGRTRARSRGCRLCRVACR